MVGIFKQNKEKIIKWYIEDEISGCKIIKLLGTKNKKIYKFLRDCGVNIRSRSEARSGMKIPREIVDKIKNTKKIRNSYNPFKDIGGEFSKKNKGKTYEEIYGCKKSKEIKEKLSLKLTGRKGWKPTSSQKIMHSIKMRGKNSREKNYFWNGGIYKSSYPKEFDGLLKLKIRERDYFTCQECCTNEDILGYKLHIHHIDFNKKNCNMENLISLCRKCHSKTQYKKKDWIKYYKNKMSYIKCHQV